MATQLATQVIGTTQVSEDKLIRAGQRGDAQAIETLFRRYHRPLFQTALRVLGNSEDAEDALQDGLLSAYRNLKRFEGRSQFSTWLTRIVINAALMKRRSAKARPAVSLEFSPLRDSVPEHAPGLATILRNQGEHVQRGEGQHCVFDILRGRDHCEQRSHYCNRRRHRADERQRPEYRACRLADGPRERRRCRSIIPAKLP